jgi:hypothetical protein
MSLIFACALYRSTIWFDPRPPSGSEGFVVYASDYADNLDDVHLLVDKIEVAGEQSSGALQLIWAFRAQGLNSTLTVGVRVPRDAEMQEAQVVMLFKDGSETKKLMFNRSYMEHENATYFEATTSRLSKDGKLVCTEFHFETHLFWKGFLYRKSFSRYSLIVPFSFSDTGHFPHLKPFYLDETNWSVLSVRPPSDSNVVQTSPSAEEFTFAEGGLWYIWNISSIAKPWPVSVAAVAVDLEVNSLAKIEQDVGYWTSLGFGIGVPLALTSFIELLKLRRTREKYPHGGCSALQLFLSPR